MQAAGIYVLAPAFAGSNTSSVVEEFRACLASLSSVEENTGVAVNTTAERVKRLLEATDRVTWFVEDSGLLYDGLLGPTSSTLNSKASNNSHSNAVAIRSADGSATEGDSLVRCPTGMPCLAMFTEQVHVQQECCFRTIRLRSMRA
jgi:hypothetical protein